MQIKFNTYTMHLEDLPRDIGYASEKITFKDAKEQELIIGGQNGKTQLLITTPAIDQAFIEE